MQSNLGTIRPNELFIGNVDLHHEMALYDSLPLEWRQLVGQLPLRHGLELIVQALHQRGPVSGFLLIVDLMAQEYPGWNFQSLLQSSQTIVRKNGTKETNHRNPRRRREW